MKELKTYAHLYLGCDAIINHETGLLEIGKLIGVTASEIEPSMTLAIINLSEGIAFQEFYIDEVKLILRPLSEMTEDDVDLGDFMPEFDILIQRYTGGYYVELDSIHDDGYCLTVYPDGSMYCICKDNMENYPYNGGDLFNQLLSKGFDLFGLIDSGLAVSKTETKN